MIVSLPLARRQLLCGVLAATALVSISASAPRGGGFSLEVLWPEYDIAPGLLRAKCDDILDRQYVFGLITRAP
jgi:hypothetical protein